MNKNKIDELAAENNLLSALVTDLKKKLEAAEAELERVKMDHVMNIYTRDAIFKELIQEHKKTQRHGGKLGVIMIDIDHFKQFNDAHGHQTGDDVLYEVAQLIQKTIRESDEVGRYGGEEIMVVLPDTDTEGAYKVAEKIRKAVKSASFSMFHLKLTISLGVAEYDSHLTANEDPHKVIGRADAALYASKHNGRNKTTKAGK